MLGGFPGWEGHLPGSSVNSVKLSGKSVRGPDRSGVLRDRLAALPWFEGVKGYGERVSARLWCVKWPFRV